MHCTLDLTGRSATGQGLHVWMAKNSVRLTCLDQNSHVPLAFSWKTNGTSHLCPVRWGYDQREYIQNNMLVSGVEYENSAYLVNMATWKNGLKGQISMPEEKRIGITELLDGTIVEVQSLGVQLPIVCFGHSWVFHRLPFISTVLRVSLLLITVYTQV